MAKGKRKAAKGDVATNAQAARLGSHSQIYLIESREWLR
jgi:hypothetical protein